MKKSIEALAGEIAPFLTEKYLSRLAQLLYYELLKRKKISSLERFLKLLRQERAKGENRLTLEIISAKELTEQEKELIKKRIERKYHPLKIELIYEEDERILGGVKISSAKETIDLSWTGKINKLKKAIGASYG